MKHKKKVRGRNKENGLFRNRNLSHKWKINWQGPSWRRCNGCSCTHRFSESLFLNQQILRREGFYTLNLHNSHSKVILLSVFWSIFENLQPQFWNPSNGPSWVSRSRITWAQHYKSRFNTYIIVFINQEIFVLGLLVETLKPL